MKILIADSGRTTRDQAVRWLVDRRHEAQGVGDAKALLALLAREPVDAVLIESTLGGATAHELIRRIRAGQKERPVYIVIMLDLEPSSAILDYVDAGADDFLRKRSAREELVVRMETPARLRAWRATAEPTSSHIDWSSPTDSKPAHWVQMADELIDALGAMLGASLEPIERAAMEAPAFAATIPLTSTGQSAGCDVNVIASTASMAELARRLLGEGSITRDAQEDVLREITNTAAGVLKRNAQSEGVILTTGLPMNVTPKLISTLSSERATTLGFRIRGTSFDFSIVVNPKPRMVEWIPATQLREGMVLLKDLHNDGGSLLLSAGTRVSSTAAERIARMVGAKLIEVCLAA